MKQFFNIQAGLQVRLTEETYAVRVHCTFSMNSLRRPRVSMLCSCRLELSKH